LRDLSATALANALSPIELTRAIGSTCPLLFFEFVLGGKKLSDQLLDMHFSIQNGVIQIISVLAILVDGLRNFTDLLPQQVFKAARVRFCQPESSFQILLNFYEMLKSFAIGRSFKFEHNS
jgi:hypothetical protein